MAFIKGQAGQVIGAQMVSATDGSAFVGSTTLYVTGDGGTQTLSGTCVSEGNGYHSRTLTAAETDFTQVAYTFIGTGAVPQTLQLFPQTIPTLTPTQGTDAASAVSAYDLITDAYAELNVFLPANPSRMAMPNSASARSTGCSDRGRSNTSPSRARRGCCSISWPTKAGRRIRTRSDRAATSIRHARPIPRPCAAPRWRW